LGRRLRNDEMIPVIASEAKQSRRLEGQNKSSYKSRHCGFNASINANFFLRDPALICFMLRFLTPCWIASSCFAPLAILAMTEMQQ
ncbi:MAG: hypothetical protein ACREEN_02045, partial [Stellaceae bacterium]